ncbi:RNA polymerase sigma factor [Gelidibacter salicanalis]|uniref:RNA polymerase sigma factor n=1 Tax=Gelidibacter salicanalis TaxID=291193 RepID=A0A934KTL7_9FLAO|nr:RNA polymerase sigma-70 factor [Gelidibacter salicanalis]MBJ7879220.1 RNA polymerase sigma-70 factor [Gelidibacter salicanalis]
MEEKELHSDKLLVNQLMIGNHKAFRKLFDTYRNDLYKFSLSMVHSTPYAEEIVQDVFLKVWLKRESLNPDMSFRAYLFTITRNKTLKFLKKAANNQKLREEVYYASQKITNITEHSIRESELEIIKNEALNKLPPRRLLIFEMSRNEGKSYDTIAEELRISPHTVRNQMSKALETLRTTLIENKDIAFIIIILFFNNYL